VRSGRTVIASEAKQFGFWRKPLWIVAPLSLFAMTTRNPVVAARLSPPSSAAGYSIVSAFSSIVVAGLDPVAHAEVRRASCAGSSRWRGCMDCRVKPGNDAAECVFAAHARPSFCRYDAQKSPNLIFVIRRRRWFPAAVAIKPGQ